MGGSQFMRIVMKNNRNLVKGRKKGFFKRDLSYKELKKYYKESSSPLARGKGTNSIALREIREKIIRERKRNFIFQFCFTLVVLTGVVSGLYSFLTSTKHYVRPVEKYKTERSCAENNQSYERNMEYGYSNLNSGNYFLAVGNFEKALKLEPTNIDAEYALAETYLKACYIKNEYCSEANDFALKLEKKYPHQKGISKLKGMYAK